MADDYDVIVIGAGTGGYSCALRAAELGKRVALVERDERLGGTCLLRGCIPTKALLQSASVLDAVNRSEQWGIIATGRVDRDGVIAFRDASVDKLVTGLTGLLRARGVDVVHGTARLVARGEAAGAADASDSPDVAVDGRVLTASDIVVATGSRPRLLPGVELTERIVSSDEALELAPIPASAVVIGAGAVGLEFASLYRSLGAEVTLLEALPRLAPLEDEDISAQLARAFRKRRIDAHVSASVREVKDRGDSVEVSYEDGSNATISADVCLVAIGRGPVTDDLGLEAVGAELDRGFVKVDGQLQTTAPHVWSVGDAAATPLQLAHVAFTEGIAVAERIAGEAVPEIDYAGIPRVTYCSPEVASVGLTEAQAAERGHDVAVERLDFRAIGKANIVGEGGLAKLVADADGGTVLGVHLIGPHVTDLIAEGMLITNWEATAADVASLIHPHPTLSEAIGEAHLALAGKALHSA
jgi:dihydrolipoamide dehydrogenase